MNSNIGLKKIVIPFDRIKANDPNSKDDIVFHYKLKGQDDGCTLKYGSGKEENFRIPGKIELVKVVDNDGNRAGTGGVNIYFYPRVTSNGQELRAPAAKSLVNSKKLLTSTAKNGASPAVESDFSSDRSVESESSVVEKGRIGQRLTEKPEGPVEAVDINIEALGSEKDANTPADTVEQSLQEKETDFASFLSRGSASIDGASDAKYFSPPRRDIGSKEGRMFGKVFGMVIAPRKRAELTPQGYLGIDVNIHDISGKTLSQHADELLQEEEKVTAVLSGLRAEEKSGSQGKRLNALLSKIATGKQFLTALSAEVMTRESVKAIEEQLTEFKEHKKTFPSRFLFWKRMTARQRYERDFSKLLKKVGHDLFKTKFERDIWIQKLMHGAAGRSSSKPALSDVKPVDNMKGRGPAPELHQLQFRMAKPPRMGAFDVPRELSVGWGMLNKNILKAKYSPSSAVKRLLETYKTSYDSAVRMARKCGVGQENKQEGKVLPFNEHRDYGWLLNEVVRNAPAGAMSYGNDSLSPGERDNTLVDRLEGRTDGVDPKSPTTYSLAVSTLKKLEHESTAQHRDSCAESLIVRFN